MEIRSAAAPLARRLSAQMLVVLAVVVPALLAAPAPVALAATPTATFNYTAAATAPVGSGPDAIAAGDLNGDTKQDLVVANYNDGTVSVLLNNGNAIFTPAPGSPIRVGNQPTAIVFADFNTDGKLDFVTANAYDNTVSVFLGNGNGTFTQAPGSPITVGMGPDALAVMDFDNNGTKDLAIANATDNTVTILLGSGTGTFTPATGSPIAVGHLHYFYQDPSSIAAMDLNHDGKADLVVLNAGDNTVSVLLGTGTGAFAPASGSPFSLGSLTSPTALVVSDLDGGTTPDIILTQSYPGNGMVFLGNGDGTFTAGSAITGSGARIAIGDVNGDVKPDLLTGYDGSGLQELLGTGTGTFASPVNYPVGQTGYCHACFYARGIVIADLNGDTRMDFVTTNTADNTLSIYTGNGAGVFTLASPAPAIPCNAPAVGDVNGDHRADIVANCTGGVSVFLGNTNGTFTLGASSPIYTDGSATSQLTIGDVTGDGKPDIVFQSSFSHKVGVLVGAGNGAFTLNGTTTNVGANPGCITVADLNNDGKADLIVPPDYQNTNTLGIWLSNGMGGFTQATGSPFAVGTSFKGCVVVANLGNGHPDLVVRNSDNTISVLLGTGTGTFTNAPGSPITIADGAGYSVGAVAVADVSGDGKPDLVVVDNYYKVHVLLGAGTGAFTEATGSPYIVYDGLGPVVIGDLNGDGTMDIAIAEGGGQVWALLGNGAGAFVANPGAPPRIAQPTFAPLGLNFFAADLNGDGKLDLVGEGNGSVSILLNTTIGVPNPLPAPKPPGASQPGPPNPLPVPPKPPGPNNGVPAPLPPRRP